MADEVKAVSEAIKQLSFPITPDVAGRLEDLRNLVRGKGHARPSQKVIVEALIWAAEQDGRSLELNVLAPYRDDHPQIDV